MAKDDDLDLDVGAEKAKSGGGSLKIILFVLVGLLVGGGIAGGAAFFLLSGGGEGGEREEFISPSAPLINKPLQPAFVGNIGSTGGRLRFFQVEIVVAARDQRVLDAVDLHMPEIRNNLLMLMSDMVVEEVTTREGREVARREMLGAIQDVLQQRIGRPGVEDIFFTSFVIQ